MFVRPCWKPVADNDSIELMKSNPWALLVSNSPRGPVATNLPLLFDPQRADQKVLIGHVARANEHYSLLEQAAQQDAAPVLAIFEGPWSYVTASWYPRRDMPSTYYYTAVHCYGRIQWQSDDELDASLELLTRTMEDPIPGGWKTAEIPRSEITRRFSSIRGFALHIDRLEAKFKLGQDEPLKDALSVAANLKSTDPELSELIEQQNAPRAR